MHRVHRLLLIFCLLAGALVCTPIRADSGDVEGSHDYSVWTRMPGFEITDYDEDNPSEFTFSVSRPLAIDANHLEAVPVEGHRYVIRYEWSNSGQPPSLLKSQRHYEKLAAAAGYTVEKSGAVGNVTETFHQTKGNQQIWVFLVPSGRVNMLTIVESRMANMTLATASPPPTPPAPPSATTPMSTAPPVAVTPNPALPPAVPPAPSLTSPAQDPLITDLTDTGRAVLPVTFRPGKPELNGDAKPVIDRVVAYLKLHPEVTLAIEGHTDTTGDEQANLELSKERALTVKAMLVEGHIKSKRLTAVGLGGTQPVADEGTAEGREKNRRIELVVKKGLVKKEPAQKEVSQGEVSPPLDPGAASASGDPFHATAPDGVNYYPAAATAPAVKPKAAH